MQFKPSILTVSLLTILTLSGCNDSSSPTPNTESSTTPDNNSVTVKAIDGYLANAEVCIDKNNNAICEDAEKLKTHTNKNGEVNIDIADAKYNIIVTAKAGQTSDSDRGGVLGKDYQYILKANPETTAGSTVTVTPFTTLAYKNNKTIEQIAADLNIPATVISGDYVALKREDGENKNSAKKAHLLARSITTTLPSTIDKINPTLLDTSISKIQDKISELENTDKDLDSITIEISDKGVADSVTTYTLNKYFSHAEGDEPHNYMYMTSLNKAYADKEGTKYVAVIADKTIIMAPKDINDPTTYQFKIDGNDLITTKEGSESTKDTFIYLSHEVSLSVPQADGDLTLWKKRGEFTPTSLESETFIDRKFYFISDDSTNTDANPIIAEMTFSQDKVTIVEEGLETMSLSWSIDESGHLFIEFPEGDTNMTLALISKDSNIMITKDQNRTNTFGMFLSSKNMANMIMQKWSAIKK
ncbi:hypothetical protein I3271_11540 [Photobacterium leiognathi]|uniref:hypothetical protein n=1 Tax=Photobacterium leiognathi TaxID=553611 RepID=UPI001EDDCFC5|nr:hypothetical protein [Photobacterium leiognathi]MCG3885312.1 hypothetical protein [Photobacterium leiognathi]